MHRAWVDSPDYRAVIEVLTAMRTGQGLSQRGLAARLGKPPSFINKIELLERRLDVLELIKIARAMNVAPADLITKMAAVCPTEM